MFTWQATNVGSRLPGGWEEAVYEVALKEASDHWIRPRSVTSREDDADSVIVLHTVDGVVVSDLLPWLAEAYNGMLRDIVERLWNEPIATASNIIRGVNLNVQFGTDERYECHVDSNPIQGILYATSHPPSAGGELVVSNNSAARGVAAIERDAVLIHPVAGQFILFDGRQNPHFVRPLTRPGDVRVAVVMNFYTTSCPERDRPADLDRHLFGHDLV